MSILTDVSFANVSLLARMYGVAGSTTFLDESLNHIAITASGGAALSNAQVNYGATSGFFTGVGEKISFPLTAGGVLDLATGAGDWTVEYWIYPLSAAPMTSRLHMDLTSGLTTLFGIYHDLNTPPILTCYITGGWTNGGGGATTVNFPGQLHLNMWNHIAVMRNGSALYLCLNGVSNSTPINAVIPVPASNTGYVGGGSPSFSTDGADYYIEGLRITKGLARYSHNLTFQVPPYAFPLADSILCDASLSGLQQLVTFDGANGATSFTESSVNAFTYSGAGNGALSTSQTKFGSASLAALGGAGHNVSTGAISSALITSPGPLDIGSGDWTLECWIYPLDIVGQQILYATSNNGASKGYRLYINNDQFTFQSFGPPLGPFAASGVVANAWTHVAMVRAGTGIVAYVNGIGGGLNVAGDFQDLLKALPLILALGEAQPGSRHARQRLGPTAQRFLGNRFHQHDATNAD